jgi:hypothetical protein
MMNKNYVVHGVKAQSMILLMAGLIVSLFIGCAGSRPVTGMKQPTVIVFQPSHQSDTGGDYNEATVCNSIVEYAMRGGAISSTDIYKVWSYNIAGLHHAQTGSNTKRSQTVDTDSGRISGYAYELQESNKLHPKFFIAVHNNGGTRRNACWGFVHEGDSLEAENRKLATLFVDAVCNVTGLQNAGVHGDSEPNRNDYRCSSTGKLSFYSLDEHVNNAPYRILLEIGDNAVSRALLLDPGKQKAMGEAIRKTLENKILN